MKTSKLIQVAGQSIVKNKMRTLLTMLGIIIGVGAVILMVAVGQGAQSVIQQQIDNLGSNLIVITPGESSMGGVSRGPGSFNTLTVEDAEKLQAEGFLLAAVSPVIFAPGQIIGGDGNWFCVSNGVSHDYPAIRDWPLESGHFFDEVDVRTRRKVAVLGRTVADELWPNMDPIGDRVRIRDVPFEIIGVLVEKGQTASGDDQDNVILMPYTTANTHLSGRKFIGQILVSTYGPEDIPAAEEEVAAIIRESHRLAEWDEDDFTVRNQTDIAETSLTATRAMSLLLAAIASISLLVGGVGIMNIMLVSVTERTREIGIRMAIGARSSDLLTQFLVESAVMSLIGGIIGIGVGFGGARILSQITGWSTAISPQIVMIAIVFSASVGIFFGFYPAWKASAMNPIDALRYE